ncbi:MAG: type IX secretion system outer membrane channel protein PorV [Chitinophagaceae bacterium]
MKSMFHKYVAAIAFCSLAGMANAQNTTLKITNAAVPALQISPDAKAGGMGDVAIGTDADAGSMLYNFSKIVFARKASGVAATYTPWMKEIADDMSFTALSGYHQLSEQEAIGGAVRYFSLGNVDLLDYNGNKVQTNHPNEYTIDFGYARKLSDQIGIGIQLRYISSGLLNGAADGVNYKRGNAVAGDISLFYNGLRDSAKGWTAGISVTNLGNKISYSGNGSEKGFLPASLNAGFAYRETWEQDHHFLLGVDVNKSLVPAMPDNNEELPAYYDKSVVNSWFSSFGNNAWQFGAGAEYNYKELLYLRAGYRSQSFTEGHWQYLTAGLGLRLNDIALNFSYIIPTGDQLTRNPFVNTVRFGAAFSWGEGK